MLQYRAEITLWALWSIVSPAVLMAVWSAAAASSSTPGHIGSFSSGQMLAYFFMTMIVGHVTTAWDLFEMGYLVRTGRLSPLLLRPIAPVWQGLMENTAYKLVTFFIISPIWLTLALIIRPQFDTKPRDFALGLVALVLASLLNFVWGYAAAGLAFFVTKMDAIAELYFGGSLFFGGRLAPIALLPGPLAVVAGFMPFQWIYSFPAQLLAGQLPLETIVAGLAWQTGWLIAGIIGIRFMWGLGLRRYSAVGA